MSERAQEHEWLRLRRMFEIGMLLAEGDSAAIHALFPVDPDARTPLLAGAGPLAQSLIAAAREFLARALSDRERLRVAAALLCAARRAIANLEGGQKPRDDDFFTVSGTRRSAVDELIEGGLVAAQREHEEAKLPLWGNLIANIAFRQYLDRGHAQMLIGQTASLSHRQLSLLAAFADPERLKLRHRNFVNEPRVPFDTVAMLWEVRELERRDFVEQTEGTVENLVEIVPSQVLLHGPGTQLHRRLNLDEIPLPELIQLTEPLRFRGVSGVEEWAGAGATKPASSRLAELARSSAGA